MSGSAPAPAPAPGGGSSAAPERRRARESHGSSWLRPTKYRVTMGFLLGLAACQGCNKGCHNDVVRVGDKAMNQGIRTAWNDAWETAKKRMQSADPDPDPARNPNTPIKDAENPPADWEVSDYVQWKKDGTFVRTSKPLSEGWVIAVRRDASGKSPATRINKDGLRQDNPKMGLQNATSALFYFELKDGYKSPTGNDTAHEKLMPREN